MLQMGQPWLSPGVVLLVAVLFPLQRALPGEPRPEDHFKQGMEAARHIRGHLALGKPDRRPWAQRAYDEPAGN